MEWVPAVEEDGAEEEELEDHAAEDGDLEDRGVTVYALTVDIRYRMKGECPADR